MLSAEEVSGGNAAELSVETNLLRGPQEDAEVVGRLPKGTILTVLGDSEGAYIKVEVELVEGVERGWIDGSSIKSSSQQEREDEKAEKKSSRAKKKKRKKLPDDELAVIHRDPTFAYGIYAGGNYGILVPSFDSEAYRGIGGQGGGFVQWYLSRESAVGLEVGVTQLSGTQSTLDSGGLLKSGSARFLDVTALYEYLYQSFRLFGGLQYSLGIGIADFPSASSGGPPAASDLGGLWFKAGGGYAIPLSDVVNLVGKGSFGISFNREYIGFQTFAFSLHLEFRG